MENINWFADKVQKDVKHAISEVQEECNPFKLLPGTEAVKSFNIKDYIHIPYFPAFHQPGWLTRYIVGPYDQEWADLFFADLQAGITVVMTLVPQGLSQATLALMPPIYGLYTAIVPSLTYAFFGSSMQLTLGPTALISLMTGSLLTKYGVDYNDDFYMALDTAAQAAFCVGIIIAVLGVLNLGNLIQFMSYPVMSGFTTGAAMTIGLTQLKSAFGFALTPPNAGGDVDYNYEVMHWWTQNWKQHDASGHPYRNHYAVAICFGLYVPLICVQMFKWYVKPSAETKKTIWYKVLNFISNVLPLVAIIIGGGIAYNIKKDDHFNDPNVVHSYYAKGLKIVGKVEPGVTVGRIPVFHHPMGQFLADVLPLTLIAFMESYSIARNIAAQNNQLHLLNASQEMWANGVANLFGCITSAYPVSGSFSRSALNAASGAKTPLAKVITTCCLLICLSTLTKAMQYIPSAALATVIFMAISNIMNISDLWLAWKHSKKDFFVMVVTITFVFVFDTSIGLAVGLGTSVIVYCVFDIILAKSHEPRLFTSSRDSNEVDVVRIESDVVFLTAFKIKDFIASLSVLIPSEAAATNEYELLRFKVGHTFDKYLKPNLIAGVEKLPKAIVVDMCVVKTIDLSGLEALATAAVEVRSRGVLVTFINCAPDIEAAMTKFNIKSDESNDSVDFKEYEDAYRLDMWTIHDKYAASRPVDVEAGKRKHFQEIELHKVSDGTTTPHHHTNGQQQQKPNAGQYQPVAVAIPVDEKNQQL